MDYPTLFDFKTEQKCSILTRTRYKDALPAELLQIWKEYGFGSFMDGYLHLVNPSDYTDFLKDTFYGSRDAIPFMVSAFGDLFLWKNGHIYLLYYRYGEFHVIGKSFSRFLENLSDPTFQEKYLWNTLYSEARERLGTPAGDECFGFVPALSAGGTEDVSHLAIVKTKEHISFLTQLTGKIGDESLL